MITPKPKSVVELFEGHPERWTKGSFGRKANGNHVWNTDEEEGNECVCFCIAGAYKFIHGKTVFYLSAKLDSVWNDAPERTFEEVLAKCKELNI